MSGICTPMMSLSPEALIRSRYGSRVPVPSCTNTLTTPSPFPSFNTTTGSICPLGAAFSASSVLESASASELTVGLSIIFLKSHSHSSSAASSTFFFIWAASLVAKSESPPSSKKSSSLLTLSAPSTSENSTARRASKSLR